MIMPLSHGKKEYVSALDTATIDSATIGCESITNG
jgi:hypothetical protein